MKALSIRQPWAWAILHAGKDVENRDWKPWSPAMRDACALIGAGRTILLHASKGMTGAEYGDFVQTYRAIECGHRDLGDPSHPRFAKDTHVDIPPANALPRGGVVGSMRLESYVEESVSADEYEAVGNSWRARARRSPWFFGPYAFALVEVRPTKFIEFKGALGFFEVPDHIAREALVG